MRDSEEKGEGERKGRRVEERKGKGGKGEDEREMDGQKGEIEKRERGGKLGREIKRKE